jgi:hypothetical protein
MEMLRRVRELANTSSCMETIGRCNDLITKSIKLALKKAGSEITKPYSLNQLKEAGLPGWYLEKVKEACSEAGVLPFCAFILEVPRYQEGCTELDVMRALDATKKVLDATKKFLESTGGDENEG